MLKAIRFDLEEHKEIINYIENYRDKKNRENHSEAMRFLMMKGLESLNSGEPQKQESSQFDIESLKQELFNQLMSELKPHASERPFTKINKLTPSKEETHGIKEPPTTPRPPAPSSQRPKPSGNGLLDNLLGNSQR